MGGRGSWQSKLGASRVSWARWEWARPAQGALGRGATNTGNEGLGERQKGQHDLRKVSAVCTEKNKYQLTKSINSKILESTTAERKWGN